MSGAPPPSPFGDSSDILAKYTRCALCGKTKTGWYFLNTLREDLEEGSAVCDECQKKSGKGMGLRGVEYLT